VPETVIVYVPAGVPGFPLVLLLPPPQAGIRASAANIVPIMRIANNFFRPERIETKLAPISERPATGRNIA